jgi:hypothetical protein
VRRTDGRRTGFGAAGGWAGALALLVTVSAVVRFLGVRGIPTTWVTPDETLYGLLGRGLYAHGRLSVLGGDVGFYSAIYPALAGLPLLWHDLEQGYELLKAVQALVMSLAGVVAYRWARELVAPPRAFAAAALTVAVPGLTYAGMVMSEVAFYVVVPLAAWAAARCLVAPTLGRQAVVAVAVGAAVATRLQALLLVPAVALAALLKAWFDGDARTLRRLWPLAVTGIVVAAAAIASGTSSLGGYATIASRGYDPARVAEFVGYHAGGLLLACGVVPLCAVAQLVVEVPRRGAAPVLSAYLAVATSFTVCTVAVVGSFASRYTDGIVERGLLSLLPILFVGFAVWLEDGEAARRFAVVASIAFVAAALVLTIPYTRFVGPLSVQDSMTFAAATHLGVDPLLLLGGSATALAALFALVPRRAAPLLAVVLAAAFVAESVAAAREVTSAARAQQARLLGPDPRWVDSAGTGPVAFVFGGAASFESVWEHAFWNRRIVAVYDLPGATVLGPMPQHAVEIGRDGVLRAGGRPLQERQLVLPSDLTPAGTVVTSTALADSPVAGLNLWRSDGPPRLLERRAGFGPNGDISYAGELREYGCGRGGTFLVTFLGKSEQHVDLYLNRRRIGVVRLGAGEAKTRVVHAGAAADGSCTLTLRPSTLVGTTEARFARG